MEEWNDSLVNSKIKHSIFIFFWPIVLCGIFYKIYLPFLWLLYRLFLYIFEEGFVTKDEINITSGIISHKQYHFPVAQNGVEVSFNQGFLGKKFNFGTLKLSNREKDLSISYVSDFKNVINFLYIAGFLSDAEGTRVAKVVKGTDAIIKDYSNILVNGILAVNGPSVPQIYSTANQYVSDNGMTIKEIKKADALVLNELNKYIDNFSDSLPFSEADLQKFSDLCSHLQVPTVDLMKKCRHLHILKSIELGQLPIINSNYINIVLKADEVLHYICSASLMKKKVVRAKTVNYNGLSGSIRICKGLRYRYGSIKVDVPREEYIGVDDSGSFYITNKRIGYIGNKQFTVAINKIVTLSGGEGGLYIFKEGKETPHIVSLEDYEVPCSLISYLINQ